MKLNITGSIGVINTGCEIKEQKNIVNGKLKKKHKTVINIGTDIEKQENNITEDEGPK